MGALDVLGVLEELEELWEVVGLIEAKMLLFFLFHGSSMSTLELGRVLALLPALRSM